MARRHSLALCGLLVLFAQMSFAVGEITEDDLVRNANYQQQRQEKSGMVELDSTSLLEFLAEGDKFWTACPVSEGRCGATREMVDAAARFLDQQKGTERELPVTLGFFDTSLDALPEELGELPRPESPPFTPLLQYRDGSLYAQAPIDLRATPYALLDFIFYHHSRVVPELSSREELKAYVEGNQAHAHSSLVIFGGEPGDQAHRTALSVVQDFPGIYALSAIYDEELARSELGEEYDSEGVLRVYCHFEHPHADHVMPVITGMQTISRPELTHWLHQHASRHVAEMTPKLMPVMLARFEMVILAIAPLDDEDAATLMHDAINAAAEKHPDVGFAYSDTKTAPVSYIYDGATGEVFPTAMVIFANRNWKPFAFNEEIDFTEESFLSWVRDLKRGVAVPFLKSAPVPEDDGDTSVIQELVFDSFDRKVHDAEDRVLVLISSSAPDCHECVALRGLVERVMPRFREGITVMEYDVVRNYAGVFEEHRLPELRLFEKGMYTTFPFVPSRSIEDDLVEFVNKKHRASRMRGRRRHDEL
mmetsp:Transcript_14581/g.57256  ORF Transcript_14581/g.57256 Transcript_14581/m.57256 type:complete len:534 (+) Transcript_14581:37-1638(+)